MHRDLELLGEALDGAQVAWCLLRLPRDVDQPPGDVDFLVDPGDIRAFDSAARACGFVGVPGWQAPPSLLYLRLDAAAGRFLTLDVTERVAFGRDGAITTPFAAGALRRRVRQGAVVMPSPDDAFWLLLLHCLLDKGSVPLHYRDRLTTGARGARTDGEIARAIDAVPNSPVGSRVLRDLAGAGDWARLAAVADGLSTAWRRSMPYPARVRRTSALARRALTRPALLGRRRGLSVALLGPNGAGKSTLAAGIADCFPLPVTQVYMGLWKGTDDATGARRVAAAATRPFRGWARFLRAQLHQARGRLVVFDRYVYDARRPAEPGAGLAERAYMWLLSRSCPAPDLVLLLELAGSVAHARKAENSLAETEAEASGYLSLDGELPVHRLDASLDADRVRSEALVLIWGACVDRWHRGRPVTPESALTP
ncbi:hypothetical protein [Modestobacter sp. URMC 112]